MDAAFRGPSSASEANSSDDLPRTPPYTPRRVRESLKRADSPASIKSLHPTETISPSKNSDHCTQDSVKVEELQEGDAGYLADVDLVYPEELEEPQSNTHSESDSSSGSDVSDNGISQHFSRLDCDDAVPEGDFERNRRAKRVKKRRESRLFKRTHSQSVKGDVEMADSDAMGDQDRPSSARRLRRRVWGSTGVAVSPDEMQRTPPPSREGTGRTESAQSDYRTTHSGRQTPSNVDDMDVDNLE